MKFRKLERWEHDRTKALYETVFSEDKGAFADYYYTWKTKDNTIYAAEDEHGIHAMVHLNPFEVSVYGKVRVLHYIVAVATEESYRHRSLMRNLLNLAMREMAEDGEPFTFLMPASEAIYLPFGFRFASWQRQGILRARPGKDLNCQNREGGKKAGCGTFCTEWEASEKTHQAERKANEEVHQAERKLDEEVHQAEQKMNREMSETKEGALRRGQRTCGICRECRPIRPEEYQALADMVNETLAGQADIFIRRNRAYYERLVEEQRCQGGDVMAVLAKDRIVGTFCTAREEPEDGFELREIIALREFRDLVFAALQSFVDANGDCRVYGCPDDLPLAEEKRVPLMMARRLSREGWDLPEEHASLKAAELSGAVIFINEVV